MFYFHRLSLLILIIIISSCQSKSPKDQNTDSTNYYSYDDPVRKLSGGVKMIPIQTSSGEYNVWTKRIGNNPTKKVLLLHGGPGITHEYFECFDSYFPDAGIEYYYYDQLESWYSDKPGDTSLWTIERFVDEVEQVRKALALSKDNFYLLGNSWGGILCMEYALKHQENLKGLIIANMVSSIPHYNKYANEVLGPQLAPEVLKEIKELEANKDYNNPRYGDLLFNHYYTEHILRMPLEQWPDPVKRTFEHINGNLYLHVQGPSEFGIVGDAVLQGWDVSADLHKITVPTLNIGAKYDTMDPEYMKWMSEQMPNGKYLHCAQGSHLCMYDDQEVYFEGLIQFINDVDLSY
ncbi:MAG: proline iminopeptidase-family hydrolase [Bacteroidia bacterium]|nr:proline iminopeptidase-family hydrolase [Bacteroidia bacterium]